MNYVDSLSRYFLFFFFSKTQVVWSPHWKNVTSPLRSSCLSPCRIFLVASELEFLNVVLELPKDKKETVRDETAGIPHDVLARLIWKLLRTAPCARVSSKPEFERYDFWKMTIKNLVRCVSYKRKTKWLMVRITYGVFFFFFLISRASPLRRTLYTVV